ncbi:unnamed protein product [Pieris brassicae]|uniref:Ommochrome-binding protein-like n=1 Tax=Pieris brassicae TaxID=7116 RepID=A0A9P0TG48_PIEBR|nr:unnamed protein product [Pieris brassicae]
MIERNRIFKPIFILFALMFVSVAKICEFPSEETNKQCFVKQTLASLAHSPNQLAVDKLTNTLYFSFDAGQGEYLPGALQIDTKRLTVLKGVKDAFAIASDEVANEMYFGGSHGVYKYNPTFKTLKRLDVSNLDIWWLVVKERLYFVRFPSLKAYSYLNRTVRAMPEIQHTVNQFVFDAENNIYFINSSGLFSVKYNESHALLVKTYPRFLGIATDNTRQIYLSSEDTIYVLSKILQKLKAIVSIPGVMGMSFDRENNLIYSNSQEIVRLTTTNEE